MARSLPLYLPVTISARKNYTAQITICAGSTALDTSLLAVYAIPTFATNERIVAWPTPATTAPYQMIFSPGDPLQWRTGTRAFAYDTPIAPAGTYPVLAQRGQAAVTWSYSGGVLSVTFAYGSSYPPDTAAYVADPFSTQYVPVRYKWSAVLTSSDGTVTKLVDGSPITVLLSPADAVAAAKAAAAAAKVAAAAAFTVCDGKVT